MKRTIIALVAAALCGWALWQAARIGLAKTLDDYAIRGRHDVPTKAVLNLMSVSDPKGAIDRAVAVLPADAETRAARGEIRQRIEDYATAQSEFEAAVQLRPHDYYLWMLLGVTRDQGSNQAEALSALEQAVTLAPFYAQPHWQLGNLLLRSGKFDQAFAELRIAAESNPLLWPNVDDLAWGVYGHDAGAVLGVLRPDTDIARMAMALFLAGHDQGSIALEQFRSARVRPEQTVESLMNELLRARAFPEAYEVWNSLHGPPGASTSGVDVLRDGGFEEVLTVGQTGFGWQVPPNIDNVAMSIDEGAHQSGNKSLRLDFHGNSKPTAPLVTQIILVQPNTRYHFSMAVQSKDLVSAAEPLLMLNDASDQANTVLGQSPVLRSDPNVWREIAIDFTTRANTRAITVLIARQPCGIDPCPAFGTVWIDSISIRTVASP
jgi:tetratricopeptide (TPR) repeat protein